MKQIERGWVCMAGCSEEVLNSMDMTIFTFVRFVKNQYTIKMNKMINGVLFWQFLL